jgi:DNA polymerase-3 subunit delta
MNYLLTGPEEYLKSQFLARLKKSVLGERPGRLDLEVYSAGETQFYGILDSLKTIPFFSGNKIAVIRSVEKFSSKERAALIAYLERPNRTTTLVLESAAENASPFLGQLSGLTKQIPCNRPGEREMAAWIQRECARRKKKISQPCAELFAELAGNDLSLVSNEIDKVAAYAGETQQITERHLESVLGRSAQKTAFEIVRLVIDKKCDALLVSLEDILTREKPHGIVTILAWQFRMLLSVKDLPKGFSVEHVARTLGKSAHFVRRVAQQSRHFTTAELGKKLGLILEADLSIKTGRLEARYALESVLVKLCQ